MEKGLAMKMADLRKIYERLSLKLLKNKCLKEAPCTILVQTDTQLAGGRVTLGEMMEHAARFGQVEGLYEYYFAAHDRIPDEWRGKRVFLTDTRDDDPDCGDCVECAYWHGREIGWDCHRFKVEALVGPNDFVAVPV